MAAIRLLSAPADMPPAIEVSSQLTSLVATSGVSLATRTSTPRDGARLNDSYVWSVTASDDGSFHFYAVPRKNAADLSFSQWRDTMPPQTSSAAWALPQARSAAVQYALSASISSATYAHSLDVYA
jgi:hypothetical protein